MEVPLSVSALDDGLKVGLGRRRSGFGDHGHCSGALKSRSCARISSLVASMSPSIQRTQRLYEVVAVSMAVDRH